MPSKIAVLIVAFAFAAPVGSQSDPEDVVEYRQSVHQVLKWHFGGIRAMLKGELPYDAGRIGESARFLAATATMLPTAYAQADAVTDDSAALPEIWQDWDRFSGFLEGLQDETAVLAGVDATDRDAVTEAITGVGGACKDCHDNFKED